MLDPPVIHGASGLSGARRDVTLPLSIEGVVVTGDQRGRELGFPTANLVAPESFGAPEGVFVGTVTRADGSVFRSAISIGRRETFYEGGAPSLVEAHLIDFAGDLYGERLQVTLHVELRHQARFDSVDELVIQMRRDVARTRQLVRLDPATQLVPTASSGGGLEQVTRAAC